MVISELTGGVGNQLFQYATGHALAKRLRTDFALDIRHFEAHEAARKTNPDLPRRPFALDRFAITARPMTSLQRRWVDASRLRSSARFVERAIGRFVVPRIPTVVDRAEGDDPRLHAWRGSAYLAGTWQTEKLFADDRDALLEEFRFRHPPTAANVQLIEQMAASTAISVHFRRTDYLLAETLTKPCSLDYYARAFAIMEGRYPDASYFVFSDDPDWVAANARLPAGARMVTHNVGVDDVEDMRLMSHCDHFIIANSSFSWWGAWLSRHVGKTVIAPAIWFPNGHGSERDLVPTSWQRI